VGPLPVPLVIRNAPTSLMKDLGYGKDYKYAHNFKQGYAVQEHMPKELKDKKYYYPQKEDLKKRLNKDWEN